MMTAEELMQAAPATHFIKSWSGIVDPKDQTGATRNSVWGQLCQSEPHEPHFRLFEAFTGGRLFIDVGANCGQSIISLKAVNPDARIKSFEPTSHGFAIASLVAKVFSEAEAFDFGLSDKNTRVPIYTPVIDGLLVTPLTSLDPCAFDPGKIMYRFITDDIAKGAVVSLFAQEIQLRRGDDLKLDPDVIKIDVEGAELQVLAGLEETITAHRPLIMTEKSDALGIAAFLSDFDYDSYQYQPDQPEDRSTLKSLTIVGTTDFNTLPLNIFYVNRDRIEHYENEFGCRIQRRG